MLISYTLSPPHKNPNPQKNRDLDIQFPPVFPHPVPSHLPTKSQSPKKKSGQSISLISLCVSSSCPLSPPYRNPKPRLKKKRSGRFRFPSPSLCFLHSHLPTNLQNSNLQEEEEEISPSVLLSWEQEKEKEKGERDEQSRSKIFTYLLTYLLTYIDSMQWDLRMGCVELGWDRLLYI